TANPLAVDRLTLRPQQRRQPPRAQKGPGREQLVHPPHQRHIVVVGWSRRPIDPRAGNLQQHALPAHRQSAMTPIHERSPVRSAHLPDLLAKKSRSTISSPILACSFSISRSRSEAPPPAPLSNARAA